LDGLVKVSWLVGWMDWLIDSNVIYNQYQ